MNMPKLEQPAGNASTDDWRAYALQEDKGNADAIAEMGRDELRDKYSAPSEDAEPPADPTPADGEMVVSPANPGQDDTPAASEADASPGVVVPGFVGVTPPSPTEVPEHGVYRVTISAQQWTLDAVEFPYPTDDDPDAMYRVSREAPALVSEDEADALIQAAGKRGFALTKEKVA